MFIFHHLKKYLFLPDVRKPDAPKALKVYISTFLSIDIFEVFISFEKLGIHCNCLNREKHHHDSNLRYNLNFKIVNHFYKAPLTSHQLPTCPMVPASRQRYFLLLHSVLLFQSISDHSQAHIPRVNFLKIPYTFSSCLIPP